MSNHRSSSKDHILSWAPNIKEVCSMTGAKKETLKRDSFFFHDVSCKNKVAMNKKLGVGNKKTVHSLVSWPTHFITLGKIYHSSNCLYTKISVYFLCECWVWIVVWEPHFPLVESQDCQWPWRLPLFCWSNTPWWSRAWTDPDGRAPFILWFSPLQLCDLGQAIWTSCVSVNIILTNLPILHVAILLIL